MPVTSTDVEQIQTAILRQSYPIEAVFIANNINGNTETVANYINTLVNGRAVNRTIPPLVVVNYFEGLVPTSSRLTTLAINAQAQYDYYAGTLGSAFPGIGPYEALGLAFSDTTSWTTKFAGKSVTQVIDEAYVASMGTLPSAAQQAHFVSQHSSFVSLYTANGETAANASRHALGAVVGQILYYGGTTPGTNFYTKSRTWLTNAGNGIANYSAPL